jgi:hypothetical protein
MQSHNIMRWSLLKCMLNPAYLNIARIESALDILAKRVLVRLSNLRPVTGNAGSEPDNVTSSLPLLIGSPLST